MESKLFETIYNNLKSRVDWCNKTLGPIKSKADLEKMSLKKYQAILKMCKTLMSDMDKIYTELNHIYGMGNLTVQQQSKLISMMRKFTNYRSDIKCLASHKDINSVPNIPSTSTYQLSVLADTVLSRSVRCDKSNKETDNTEINNILPYYSFEGSSKMKVTVDITDQENIKNVWKVVGLAMEQNVGTMNRFRNQIFKLGDHYGLKWDLVSPGKIVGTLVNDKHQRVARFRSLVKIG